MKKFAFLAIALLGLSLTACNVKKAETPAATDSALVEAPADTTATPEALANVLAAQLESGDAAAVQTTVQKAQAYLGQLAAKGDTAQLRQYAEQFSAFVTQHKDKIDALTKNNPQVGALINTVATSPDKLMDVANTALKAMSATGVNAAKATEDAAKAVADQAVDQAKAAAATKVGQAATKANAKVNEVVEKAADKTNAATQKANEKVNDALNKAKDALKF